MYPGQVKRGSREVVPRDDARPGVERGRGWLLIYRYWGAMAGCRGGNVMRFRKRTLTTVCLVKINELGPYLK